MKKTISLLVTIMMLCLSVNISVFADDIPMPEITEQELSSNYTIAKEISQASVGNYGLKFYKTAIDGEIIVKYDFVYGGTSTTGIFFIYIGKNRLLYDIQYGSLAWQEYTGKWWKDTATESMTSWDGNFEARPQPTAVGTATTINCPFIKDQTYNVYIRINGTDVVFGIKKAEDTAYTYGTHTLASADTVPQDIAFRNFGIGGDAPKVKNVKVYKGKDIITTATYEKSENVISASMKVTRKSQDISGTAVLVTAVYMIDENDIPTLYSIKKSEKKDLTLGNEVTLTANGADLPEDGKYEVISYLWTDYDNITLVLDDEFKYIED